MEKMKILELTERCVKYFQKQTYSEFRIAKYKSLWRNGIIRYMAQKDIEYYSPSVGADFVSTCQLNGSTRHWDREKIRSVQVLDDIMQLGYVRNRRIAPKFVELNGEIGAEMEKLIDHLTNLRRSQSTIQVYRIRFRDFLKYLDLRGIKHVSRISGNDILTFVSSNLPNKAKIITTLRTLFRFWKEEHLIESPFDEVFDNYKVRLKERIPSYFTTEEVKRMEKSAPRESGTGKRNYAMMLLASHLGLRASDIAGLKFSDIDWDKNIITLTMKKTGKVIELPLLAEVGNAIIDYLRHGRHESVIDNVFLTSKAPYDAVTRQIVCAAIREIICKSGVDTSGKHKGPHSLRHSLASAMLANGTTIPVISESLGHRNTQTTMAYLKIDIPSLLKCALPVPEIPDSFYMQKGGAFYD